MGPTAPVAQSSLLAQTIAICSGEHPSPITAQLIPVMQPAGLKRVISYNLSNRPAQAEIRPGLHSLPPFWPMMTLHPPVQDARQTRRSTRLIQVAPGPTFPISSHFIDSRNTQLGPKPRLQSQPGGRPARLVGQGTLFSQKLPERQFVRRQKTRFAQGFVEFSQHGHQLGVLNPLPARKTNCPDERSPVWAKVDRLIAGSIEKLVAQ